MEPTLSSGTCHACDVAFSYSLIHNGFNDSAYAYCDRCGRTAMLDGWKADIPVGAQLKLHRRIEPTVEPFLAPCVCGGRFTSTAAPRCPRCNTALSAEDARGFIERDAPGTAVGWRWQGNWSGLYAIIVERKEVADPWLRPRDGEVSV